MGMGRFTCLTWIRWRKAMFRSHDHVSSSSQLYDQNTFYSAFTRDLYLVRRQVIIESPFITSKRIRSLLPIFKKLRRRGVQVVINTRDPQDHEGTYQNQAEEAVALFHALDIVVLYTAGHHRKLAIIDGEIVWEGSLNILSFSDSCEIMRRIVSPTEAEILIEFIGTKRYLQDK